MALSPRQGAAAGVFVTERTPSESAAIDRKRRASGAVGRIGRGIVANTGGIGVTVLIQLVSVPVLLSAWGVMTYGEWLVLTAVPTYLALSDLTFSSVAGNSMVLLMARGRDADAIDLGRRLWSIVTVMTGIAVLAAVAIALAFMGAITWNAAMPTSEARVVLVALFLRVAVGNQYGVLDAWFRAGGRYPLGVALGQVARLLEFGALLGAVLLGGRPDTAAIALLVGSVVGFGMSWICLRRTIPMSTFRLEMPDLKTMRELLVPGLAFMAFPVSSALSVQGFTIVMGVTLGAPAVVTFATTRTFTRIPLQVVGAIHNSIWPELSRAVGAGQLDEAREILRRSVQLALLCVLAVVSGLALFGVTAIQWLTKGLVDPPVTLVFILLIVVVANSIWYMVSSVLAATNRHRHLALVSLSATVTALVVAVPLSSAFGVEGAAVALLAAEIPVLWFVFPAALGAVHDSTGAFIRAMFDLPRGLRSVTSKARPVP
jgi:O-antigen/teichoic acid export membrane protein